MAVFTVLLSLSLFLWIHTAQATGPDPATVCEVAKLKAVGKKANCLATEKTKAMLGKPSNPAKCEGVFIRAFAKAEAAAAIAGSACPVTSDVAVIEGLVDLCIENIAATIAGMDPPPPPPPFAQFPATGQTTAYQADKNDGIAGAVAVPDDGTVQAGATLSYTYNNDGTITDNNTGLMWEKKDEAGGLHDKDNTYYWSGDGSQETIWDWLDDVNTEGGTGYAGHNDWRIPNLKELESIADIGRANPAIAPVLGLTAPALTTGAPYWSSTSSVSDPSVAFNVFFSAGNGAGTGKYTALYVRAVRGGL